MVDSPGFGILGGKSGFGLGIFIMYLMFSLTLSPHPASSIISRIVQAFASVGQKFISILYEGKEITVRGGIGATGRKRPPLVLRGIQPFAGAG